MLVFISSNKWFRAAYGKKLRKHIANTCRVHSITDFGDLPVFETPTAYPMIFIAQKESEDGIPVFTLVKSLDVPYPNVRELIEQQGRSLSHDAINGSQWMLSSTADKFRKMEKNGIPLGEFVRGQIYRGVLTGFNTAFVINGTKREELAVVD